MLRLSPISIFSGLAALMLSALFLNHGLVESALPAGPGLTLDESFNIDQGVYLADALGQHGPLLLTPTVARSVFGTPRYLPDHPPLGRLLLGICHQWTSWVIPGSETCPYNVPAARLGSCLAFALTVMLFSEMARRKFCPATGILTAALMMAMPHLTGHARLAALESSTNLAWTLSLISLFGWWTGPKPPGRIQSLVSGLFLGLLLLTKVQGIFLPPIVTIWAFVQFRKKAFVPLMLFGLAGAAVFFAGWPWLWLDPITHTLKYLGRTTVRIPLYCWYLGERYVDKDVPWHFPFVMTAASLPIFIAAGLLLRAVLSRTALFRTTKRQLETSEWLAMLSIVFPLAVFSMPGVPAYDGTRLFLIVMPPLCLLAARGFVLALQLIPKETSGPSGSEVDAASNETHRLGQYERRTTRRSMIFGACAVLISLPWTTSPGAMNHYGILCGGPQGAALLGLESSYWGEQLNGDFWNQVPEDSTIYVAPVIHQFQLTDVEQLVPIVRHRNIQLESYRYDPDLQQGLILLVHRLADLPKLLQSLPQGVKILLRYEVDGVTFARLVDTTEKSNRLPRIDTGENANGGTKIKPPDSPSD